jgi:hypothetical protein
LGTTLGSRPCTPVLRLTVVRKWIAGGPVVREEQRRHSGRPDYWMRQRRVRRPLIIIWLSVTRLCRSVAAFGSFAALQRCSQIIGNTRVTLEYARVTLDGVTALDLLCSPPSEFFGLSRAPRQPA